VIGATFALGESRLALPTAWRVPLLWAGAFGAALAAGYLLSPETLLLLVAAALALVAIPAVVTPALQLPSVGLGALLAAAVLMPVNVKRAGTPFSICILVAAGVCATALLRRWLAAPPAVRLTRAERAVVAFLGVVILAFVVGQYPWFTAAPAPMSAQVGGLGLFLLSGGLLLAVAREVRTLIQLKRLTWLFLATSALALIVIMVQPLAPGVALFNVVDATTVGSMFWTWVVAISASQALFNRELSLPWRGALALLAVLTLARGLLLAFSWASGWLPPLVAFGTVIGLRFPRLVAGVALLSAAPMLLVAGDAIGPVAQQESYSLMTRLEAVRVLWQVVERNPWLGLGPANYYHYTLQFPILGWYVRFNSHNQYLDLIAQVGVFGLLAFFWVVGETGRVAWRLHERPSSRFARAYAIGVLGGLTGSLVASALADWVVPFVYNIGIPGFRSSLLFWFFLGGTVALRRMMLAGTEPALAPRTPRHA
jgi:hypothetical protein